jgi:hypothetical protein
VFDEGFFLEDRNGDGVIDFVNAQLVLGDQASAATVAAAANVAVRLGFETMAMNLPLSESSTGVGIAIGAEAAEAIGVELDSLFPDEGLITTVEVDGRDWIVIAGPTEAGTRHAATAFAGRLPHIWNPDGPTLADVIDGIRESLAEQVVDLTTARVTRMRVRSDRVSELALSIEVPPTQIQMARRVLVDHAPSYENVEAVVLEMDGAEVRFPRIEDAARGGPIPERPGAEPKRNLDLSNLYTPDGLLGDADTNLIAERIDVVLSPFGSIEKTIDIAARLGLESAGMSVPIVRLPSEIDEPSDEPTLMLIGEHPFLDEESIPDVELDIGEGAIRVVPDAFGPKGAVVVHGGDDEALERAIEQIAERFPNLWERGKDRTTLDDVEMDLWRFLSGRSPAGQAAIALYKLDQLVAKLSGETLSSARVLVSLEKPHAGFEALVRERAALSAETIDVVIDDRDVQNAATIFDDSFEVASEVDELWRLFRERALPEAKGRAGVVVEVRVSEPPEIREQLASAIRAELGGRAEVRVLSAYKQGYSWLYDVVRPALAGTDVAAITIRFARYAPPDEWRQQAMGTPLRWLHEAFPIDEILARELKLSNDAIRFEEAPEDAPPYEVSATAADGSVLFHETFSPKIVLRPYIDRFRDYEMVNVTTGWLRVELGGETIVDQRIATDAERFWDHFQQQTIRQMYDYVMERHEGNPRGDGQDAPYFGELEVTLALSEPDYLLNLDKELISSMDALHEDIYFTTLMFYRLLGRNARGGELTYPGRVIPVMEPKADGKPGSARIRFTGFATSRPAVVIDYETPNGTKGKLRLDIPKIEMARPQALAARVRVGEPGVSRLDVRVKVDTEIDEREELAQRTRSEQVDERIISAAQVTSTLEHLAAMRARGLYPEALAYHALGELVVTAGWEHRIDWENEIVATLPPNGTPAPFPDIHRFPVRPGDGELVQWDTPMPPGEAYGVLAKMESFEEATPYKIGESYLGQDIWAMDLMAPIEASHFSHYKATTLKPTIIYSARQHANEVSSTSHVLKLAEVLLTDPEHRDKLDEVNVIVHPITNADGAQLAYDLYEKTPELLLHAGYYAALGADVTADGDEPMPIYPEAPLRRRLWNTWLPDIFLNPHGYPSHQLVQLFSEYTGLVRGGRMTERNWSMNKGWFIPGFGYTDDARFPRHKEAAFTIRDYIVKAINEADAVSAMNQRNYDRYRRYGAAFDDQEVFKLPMVDNVMIHTAIKGASAPPPGSGSSRGYNPKVTIWSGTTEAPDETAHGDWMKLVATAGLQWDLAILQYLVDGDHKIERKGKRFWGGVSWSLDRPRPPAQEVPPPRGSQEVPPPRGSEVPPPRGSRLLFEKDDPNPSTRAR